MLIGTAVAVPFALWVFILSVSEPTGSISQDDPTSAPPQSGKGREAVVSSGGPATNFTVREEREPQPVLFQPSDLISIGDYIDPDRGADLSQPAASIEIGEYIDPDRGSDYSEPLNSVEIGDYINPDRGAVLEVDPLEVLSIGDFIDPDRLSVTGSEEAVDVGEYLNPDQD